MFESFQFHFSFRQVWVGRCQSCFVNFQNFWLKYRFIFLSPRVGPVKQEFALIHHWRLHICPQVIYLFSYLNSLNRLILIGLMLFLNLQAIFAIYWFHWYLSISLISILMKALIFFRQLFLIGLEAPTNMQSFYHMEQNCPLLQFGLTLW